MADETTLGVGIDVNTGDSSGELKSLSNQLAGITERVGELGASAKTLSTLDKAARDVAKLGSNAAGAVKGVNSLAAAQRNLASASASAYARERSAAAPMSPAAASTAASQYARQQAANLPASKDQLVAQFRAERQISDEKEKQLAKLRQILSIGEQIARQQNNAAQQQKRYGSTWVQPTVNSAAGTTMGFTDMRLRQIQQAQAGYNAEVKKSVPSVAAARAALEGYNDRLANTRYALYALTNAMGITGLALAAINIGTVKAAANMETMLASIERTSGVSGNELQRLEQDFISLGQSVPTSFADLGSIATLAGQLNIPAGQIAAFTETVAQFTATTDVSVDAASKAFGRLDALLPDVKGNYEALGSSILNVGVNSVATESEIINTTSQIAAAGAQAGLAASEVIGLSASYASLAIAPESARGTTIRVFSEIRTAINDGSDDLMVFAKLAGMSGEAFQQAWGTDAGATFIKVLEGLKTEGAGAEDVLRGLGITAVRDIRALLALSQNAEIVAANFGYAGEGFSEASKLAESFAIIAETLNAKFQILLNSLQAFIAALGTAGLPVISSVVDALSGMSGVMTELASNPVAQSISVLIGVLTAASAVILLAGSGFGKMVAAVLAGRPVIALATHSYTLMAAKIAVVGRAANVAGVSLNKMQMAAVAGGAAVKGFAASAGALAAVVIILSGVSMIWDSIAKSMRSASEVAKESVGDFSGLSSALQKDTQILGENAKGYQSVVASIKTTKTEAEGWVGVLETATGAQVDLGEGTEHTTTTIKKQTVTIGENSRQWIAEMLSKSKAVQDFVKLAEKMGQTDLVNNYLGALIEGDIEKANRLRDAFLLAGASYGVVTKLGNGSVVSAQDASDALALMKTISDETKGSIQNATDEMKTQEAVSAALGIQLDLTSTGMDEFGDSTSTTADKMSELTAAIETAFASTNGVAQFAADFETLMLGIAEGGASMDMFGEAGRTNLENLQASIASTIGSAGAMGADATQAVAALFMELQKQGVDTASLLASLSGKSFGGGVSVEGVQKYLTGTKQMTGSSNLLTQAMSDLSNTANNKASKSLNKVGGSASKAAAKIVTLKDYASDLGSLMSRAFEIRFSGAQSLDQITSGWQALADAADAARRSMTDIQNKMLELQSNKVTTEYFLNVAIDYKDTLRAQELTAELAKINADLADESANLSDAQAKSSMTLEGNSAAAISNRSSILGLVGDYQGYLEALAASGASQAELQSKSVQLRAEFEAQAARMGYNAVEVAKYSQSFADMTMVINRVPRNITITANANPALQALAEFESAAARAGANAGSSIAGGMSAGISKVARGLVLQGKMLETQTTLTNLMNTGNFAGAAAYAYTLRTQLAQMSAQINSGSYYSGGYTGDVGSRTVAGTVHGKEFVVDADNTKRLGTPFLNALNNGSTPAVPTGSGMAGVVEVQLSPEDRRLLAAAGNVQLFLDGRSVASATNNANGVQSHRGSN